MAHTITLEVIGKREYMFGTIGVQTSYENQPKRIMNCQQTTDGAIVQRGHRNA